MPILDAIAPARPGALRDGARRSRRDQHGRRLRTHHRRPGRVHHQHRHGRRQCRRQHGGSADGRHAAAAPHRARSRRRTSTRACRTSTRRPTSSPCSRRSPRPRYRVRSVETVLGTLKRAVQLALTAPTGPVSVEIPIDIQEALTTMPADLSPLPIERPVPSAAALDALAARLAGARRPLLWVGGGARHAGAAIQRLHEARLRRGHHHAGPRHRARGRRGLARRLQHPEAGRSSTRPATPWSWSVRACAATRRSSTKLKLPRTLYRIDADAAAEGRCYASASLRAGRFRAGPRTAWPTASQGRKVQGRPAARWSTCAPRTSRRWHRCATASARTPNSCASCSRWPAATSTGCAT
jgi:hypothetical protein